MGMTTKNDFVSRSFWEEKIMNSIIENFYFKTFGNINENLTVFRSLAVIYLGEYIKCFRYNKPQLIINSMSILCFNQTTFYKYDFKSNTNDEPKDYIKRIIHEMDDILKKITSKELDINDFESNFKFRLKMSIINDTCENELTTVEVEESNNLICIQNFTNTKGYLEFKDQLLKKKN
jgi:hypothetical protein